MAKRKFAIAGVVAAAVVALACPVLAQSPAHPPTQPSAQPPSRSGDLDAAHAALVASDYARAAALAEPLAEAGDAAAQHLMGYLYEKGFGVRADIGAALRYYGDAAVAGNADAQVALGELALGGRNAFADYERAAGWFRLAAARGDARAEVRLGMMYADGVGVARDRAVAASHFARAAAKQNADGAFYLGVAFVNGDGVPQNYPQAEKFFALAAGKGHGEAAYHLALLYDAPALGAPDPARAVAAMRAAARAGYPPAYAGMGLIAHRGDVGGDVDGVAADWFEKGMRAGDAQSAFLYAVALFKGDGRAKDPAAARAIAEQLAAAPSTPDALRANAERLMRDIARQTPGPLTLRD